MSALVTNFQARMCATCDYWTGPREPDRPGVVVKVADTSTKGKCVGKWKPNSFSAIHLCPDFKKWCALK